MHSIRSLGCQPGTTKDGHVHSSEFSLDAFLSAPLTVCRVESRAEVQCQTRWGQSVGLIDARLDFAIRSIGCLHVLRHRLYSRDLLTRTTVHRRNHRIERLDKFVFLPPFLTLTILLQGTQYAGRVVQQFSPKGKIALEIIKDLHVYVGELLKEFSNHNSRLPNKLVFYRAGVDDGSFQKVLDNELRAIQQACRGETSESLSDGSLMGIFRAVRTQSIASDLFRYCEETSQYSILHLGQTNQSNE